MERTVSMDDEKHFIKFGCMQRIVACGPKKKEFFPLAEVPSNMVTSIVHKLQNLERIKLRRTCRALNEKIEKIGLVLSSRPERDFSLRFCTGQGGCSMDMAEWKILFNYFYQFERKNCFKTVANGEQLVGLSFDSISIEVFNSEHVSFLAQILALLEKLRLGVNSLRLSNVPTDLVQQFLRVVHCKEIQFIEGQNSDILKHHQVMNREQIVLQRLQDFHGSILQQIRWFREVRLRFENISKGKMAVRNLLEDLSTVSSPCSLTSAIIEFSADTVSDLEFDLFKPFQHIALFTDFLEDKFLTCGGCNGMAIRRCLPSRIAILDSVMPYQVLVIQRELTNLPGTKSLHAAYEFRIFEDNEGIIETVLSAIAGSNWPIDFSSLTERIRSLEISQLYRELVDFMQNYMIVADEA